MATGALALAVVGSGGAGAVTTGRILLDAAGRAGRYGCMSRSSGPQIRGGESAALVRLSATPIDHVPERFDVVLGLDWRSADRFADEILTDGRGLVIADEGASNVPPEFMVAGSRLEALPLSGAARACGGRPNMVALGVLGTLAGLSAEALHEGAARALAGKGEGAAASAGAAIAKGMEIAAKAGLTALPVRSPDVAAGGRRWGLTGNEACALGAIRGGVRFVAAYPITPATEILEWLASALPRVGGVLVQAEDELASINQIIGASFGGVPALTATSGPGLSLMQESIGLAIAAEVPIVVVNVMRGGPSTGIPTKAEQADLNAALFGTHGDAPRLVLAPTSVVDAAATTEWAVRLAEQLQTAAIVLTDQALGQTRVIDAPEHLSRSHPAHVLPRPEGGEQAAPAPPPAGRWVLPEGGEGYRRYLLTPSGISPMTLPGTPGGQYTADGLEHDELGRPSSNAGVHRAQLGKRRRKLEQLDPGPGWAELAANDGNPGGEHDAAIVTWGSSTGPVRDALDALRMEGVRARMVSLRLLSPPRPAALRKALAGAREVLVVERSDGAQLYHYLRGYWDLPREARSLAVPGPLPLGAGRIARETESMLR